MKRRTLSIAMAIVMCLALCIPAFATDSAAEEVRIIEMDGITIKIFVGPAENVNARGAWPPIYGTATYNSDPLTFAFDQDEGDFSDIRVWNESTDGTDMEVTFLATIRKDGTTIRREVSETISNGERAFIQITDDNGNGLEGSVKTTMRPVRATSVDYLYLAEQSWT